MAGIDSSREKRDSMTQPPRGNTPVSTPETQVTVPGLGRLGPERDGTAQVTPRLDSLTSLRWWAAFGVFIFHMRVFAPVPWLQAFAGFGNYGVAFFFILSGFVLTWSARPGTSTKNFYWRRFARIYPAHIVALLLAIPVFYSILPGHDEPWVKPVSLGILLLSVFLVQGWSNDPQILFSGNPAAWTLTVEFFFYAIHPWVIRLMRLLSTAGLRVMLVGVVLVAFLYRALVVFSPEGWWALLPTPMIRVSEFFLGMGIAMLLRRGVSLRISPLIPLVLLAGYMGALVSMRILGTAPHLVYMIERFEAETFIVLFALLIFAFAQSDLRGGPSVFRQRWMVKLGEWSFAFYLLHATVMYTFLAIFGAQSFGVSNLVWYPVILTIGLIGAWALYRLVEAPVERRMRKWGNARWQSGS